MKIVQKDCGEEVYLWNERLSGEIQKWKQCMLICEEYVKENNIRDVPLCVVQEGSEPYSFLSYFSKPNESHLSKIDNLRCKEINEEDSATVPPVESVHDDCETFPPFSVPKFGSLVLLASGIFASFLFILSRQRHKKSDHSE